MWKRLLAVLVVVGSFAAGAAIVPSNAPSAIAQQGSRSAWDRIPEIVRDVAPSVVAVLTDRGEGSGVIWDADGVIVTNNHVIANVTSMTVLFADGERADARLLASDPRSDLAVLRTNRSGLPVASFARNIPVVRPSASPGAQAAMLPAAQAVKPPGCSASVRVPSSSLSCSFLAVRGESARLRETSSCDANRRATNWLVR